MERRSRHGLALHGIEPLEPKVLLSTFHVNSAADLLADGVTPAPGSLREAIVQANARPGADDIAFDVPTGTARWTIGVDGPLPAITDALTILGPTQPGNSSAPVVTLDGQGAGDGVDGLVVSTPGVTIRGLAINNFGRNGIAVTGSDVTGTRIEGNYLGVDPADGQAPEGNLGAGITVASGGVTIVGNVIAANAGAGIALSDAPDTVIQGNRIGTDATGRIDLGNGTWGILARDSARLVIGGATVGTGNLISGNGRDGVAVVGPLSTAAVIQGNTIGLAADGTTPLGNTNSGLYVGVGLVFSPLPVGATGATIADNVVSASGDSGIRINGGTGNRIVGNRVGTDATGRLDRGNAHEGVLLEGGVTATTVGGTAEADRNVISGNDLQGIVVANSRTSGNLVIGNLIGLDITGTTALGNGSDGVLIDGARTRPSAASRSGRGTSSRATAGRAWWSPGPGRPGP